MNASSSLVRAVPIAIVACALAGTSAGAQQDTGWTVRAFANWISPDIDHTLVFDDTSTIGVRLDGRDDTGWGLGAEYRYSSRLGFALSMGRTEPRLEASATFGPLELPEELPLFTAPLEILRIGLAVPVHLTPESRVDLWIGPSISYYDFGTVRYDDFEADGIETEAEVAVGVELGLDIPIGGRWGAHLGASYHDASLDLVDSEGAESSLAFDPLEVKVGFSVKL